MSRHSDFYMQYEDNSCPLTDIFTDSESHIWAAKAPETQGTKTKTDGIKDVSSVNDSFMGIPLMYDATKNSVQPNRAFMGHSPIFSSFPRGTNEFRVMTDTNQDQDSSLCVDSDQLNADQLSEETGFSGYFSETGIENNCARPSASSHAETDTEKFVAPVIDMKNTQATESEGVAKQDFKGDVVGREVQKPPTTAGILLEDLKAVFHLERPKAEKKLGLKRTTFSNLSRHYGISKWPFRTIRDALNRMEANKRLLDNGSVSKDRRRKLQRQQKYLHDVIDLIYKDPRHSRDSNTLAVLLVMVATKDNQ